ncbi:hypothetical protein ABW20_dc0102552 [Dactylellina cionopaga]|nr:hypothetical protein ABW20_dc0102552 [Dactylellina cionopaga]
MNPSSWTTFWKWSEEEESLLWDIQRKRNLSEGTVRAAILGFNSEALLPILLCHTPNLETLNIKEAYFECVWLQYYESDLETLDYFNRFSRFLDEHTPSGAVYNGTPYGRFGSDAGTVAFAKAAILRNLNPHNVPDERSLWFNLNLKALIPGLARLKHFEHSIQEPFRQPTQGVSGLWGLDAWALIPIFFLPRIETIQVQGISTRTIDGATTFPPLDSAISPEYAGQKSNVKRLMIWATRLRPDDIISLANITSKLEYLNWVEDFRVTMSGEEQRREVKRITSAFLQNNAETLKKDQISLFMTTTLETLEGTWG